MINLCGKCRVSILVKDDGQPMLESKDLVELRASRCAVPDRHGGLRRRALP
jgi:glutaredoxin 2